MTFNVHDRNSDLEGLLSIIQGQNPDILALQELKSDIGESLLAELQDQYPNYTLESAQIGQGLMLLSRYEISDIFRSADNRILSAIVHTPQASTLVINVHGPSKLLPFRWDEDWKEQQDFMASLASRYSETDSPVILLGDFNTTYLSENYELIHDEFHDAFEESGRGFGFTYPAQQKFGINLPWPLVGIDFIFHNDYLVSSETFVLKECGGSDHKPVITVLGYELD